MNYLNFSNKGSGFTGFMYTTPRYTKVKSKAEVKPRPTDSCMFLPPGPTWAEQITKGYNKLQEFKKIRSSETQELICVTNSLNQPSHLGKWFPRYHPQHFNSGRVLKMWFSG